MNAKSLTQHGFLDIVKFVFALLIVAAHFITENADGKINSLIGYGISIYVIVVPFFFCSAGFLIFRRFTDDLKEGKGYVLSYCKRILIMYVFWSFVYIVFQISAWIRFGVTQEEVFKYILNVVFYSTYKTIWFLPGLCIGVVLTYFLLRKIGIRYTAIIAAVCYLIGTLGVSYSFLLKDTQILDGYNYVFVSTRNGLFNGFPFVFLGAFLANQITKKRPKGFSFYIIMTIVSGVCFIAEAFLLKFIFKSINANTLLFLIPFTYFFVRLCINIPCTSGRVTKWMRKMSTVIFLSQRIFLTALPVLLPESIFAYMLSGNPYLGCLFVIAVTFVFSAVLVFLSGKSKIIGRLC